MWRALSSIGLLLGVSACTPGYDISVTVTDAINASCDTSCVGSVLLYAIGNGETRPSCAENVSVSSLRNHGLSGKFDFEPPPGFSGIWVAGFRGRTCDDVLVFDGIAPVDSDGANVPLDCVSSCKDQQPLTIKTTDVFAAMQGRCEVGPGTTAVSGVLASYRWERYADFFGVTELTSGPAVALGAGVATFPKTPVVTGRSLSCAAVAVFTGDTPVSLNCVRSSKGLCLGTADTGRVEVATLSAPVPAGTGDEYRTVVVFAERDPATQLPKPLVGATAVVEGATTAARIEYHNLTIGAGGVPSLTTRAEMSTGPSGSFSVYATTPVTVAVTYLGKTYRRLVSGGYLYVAEPRVVGAQIITPE